MSYLSDLKNGALSPLGFFKKSAGWLARQAGLGDDAEVDKLVATAEAAIDTHTAEVETAFGLMLATAFPALPEAARQVVAHRAAMAGVQAADLAVGAAGAVIKANN